MDARKSFIVCGVDGSPAGRKALDWAFDEARRRDCRLRAVSVWWWDGLHSSNSTSPEEARQHAQEVLDRVMDEALAELDDPPPETERLAVEGRPSERLCMAAVDAELLVLGSHGHGSIHDALVGSTSRHVIRHATCPVVILPDPRHAERELKRVRTHRRQAAAPGPAPMF
ncbi:nucleotide-binding universal stress UspA family protein [Kribbella sp. VKM Ac-2527]|uniref:Nucleotide-binding universal stress UspA family protein n=1 Tax=Kribbella caucasensis TaxID=2512215 RepID=A0A4R6KJK9_9ACTN|nr:universal stress protein [Kribbella sp. VKM Ac-2527]TDO49064.1 nucleotide-binding universal stress UspA family protein [Kribbella sp. VKM Ac-2527]